jgi:hypothetical protein
VSEEPLLDVGMHVNTVELLGKVQKALKVAHMMHDTELHNAAESVLSSYASCARIRRSSPARCGRVSNLLTGQ